MNYRVVIHDVAKDDIRRNAIWWLGSRPGYRAVFCISGDVVDVLTIQRAAQDSITPGDIELNL